jgi:hypothetical protein
MMAFNFETALDPPMKTFIDTPISLSE